MAAESHTHAQPGFVRIARRCWVPEAQADEFAALCAEVVRSSAPHTVVVSRAAARLHGMWLPEVPHVIDVATATPGLPAVAMTRSQRPELRVRRLALRADEVMTISGIPVTTPERTWRDLAAELDLPSLVAAGDSVLRGGTPVQRIAELLGRGTRVRGIRRARMAGVLLDGRSRSRPESHLRVAATAPDLPTFEVNEPIRRRDGGWLAEPDLSIEAAKLALEYQGAGHAEVARLRRDLTRFADLRREGWLVLAYGPAEVFGRPWEITMDVRMALRDRAPDLLRRRARDVPVWCR
ncbi:MAG: hypothetical protein QOG80_1861 [Pseudonocardiales bacterium]|jgi:hypothetical protein|nr:hypothetical protein [Pseudonocardiales bacterium]